MSMLDWAYNEIDIAIKKENPDWDGKSFDYDILCYKSALKAYESMLSDGHSGMSWAIAAQILSRLLDSKPLTALTDEEDKWVYSYEQFGFQIYQHKRYSSLFKRVHENGTFSYFDVDRWKTKLKGDDDKVTYISYMPVNNYLDNKYPIEFPYYPDKAHIVDASIHDAMYAGRKFKVVNIDGYWDSRSGEFVTIDKAFELKEDQV